MFRLIVAVIAIKSTSLLGFAEEKAQKIQPEPASRELIKRELINIYNRQGSELFYTFYYHPNTRLIFNDHINCAQWGYFCDVYFDEVPEEERLSLLEALSAQLDKMENGEYRAWWEQLKDWQRIHKQLKLIASFAHSYSDTYFINFFFEDPTLRTGLQWILHSRPTLTEFNAEIASSTLSSAESTEVYPRLVHHLFTVPEKERLECFARMYARMAQQQPAVFNDEVAN